MAPGWIGIRTPVAAPVVSQAGASTYSAASLVFAAAVRRSKGDGLRVGARLGRRAGRAVGQAAPRIWESRSRARLTRLFTVPGWHPRTRAASS